MAFLCVSQQGEFKNTIKNVFGKSMSKAISLIETRNNKNQCAKFCVSVLRDFLDSCLVSRRGNYQQITRCSQIGRLQIEDHHDASNKRSLSSK
jgi:hypothetical protein